MTRLESPMLFITGGVSGVLGTILYIVAITAPLPLQAAYSAAMLWPVLSIIFAFSFFHFIRIEKDGAANQLAFVFAILAFTLLAAMLSSQLSVTSGIDEVLQDHAAGDPGMDALPPALRLADLGLDVAWDMFIGVSLLCMAIALKGNSNFGTWWSIPAGVLGLLIIVLNVATFPWPPNTRGLFDIGPFVGLFIIILASRLVALGRNMRSQNAGNA